MKTKTRFFKAGWIAVAVFILLGAILWMIPAGFGFSGQVCFFCAGVLAAYLLLFGLAKKHPKPANVLLMILSVCVGIGILIVSVTGILIIRAWSGPVVPCDYVVVLGAGVNGTVPSLSLQDRLDAAYDYLVTYPEAVCVVSGGKGDGENITEALCMFNELTARGIAPERVWMEEQATSTQENIRFSLNLIEEKTGTRPERIGLVSSEYHLYRAGLFAREENVVSYGIPARTSWVSLRINYFLREIAGVWHHIILGG